MLEKVGIVRELKKGNIAIVEVRRTTTCGENCASCKVGCAPTDMLVEAQNHVNASVRDFVKLHTSTKQIITAAFLVYTIPLFSLIIGVLVGIGLSNYFGYNSLSEIVGIALGLIFLIGSYSYLKVKDKKIKADKDMEIQIVKILK